MATAMNINQIKSDVDKVWNMDDNEIYHYLGLAKMGTTNIMESEVSIKKLMSIAANTNADEAKRSLFVNLEELGKKYFKETWNAIKKIVCRIYTDKLQIEGKELVVYLVAAILEVIKIANPLLILIITLAVRQGLNILCEVNL